MNGFIPNNPSTLPQQPPPPPPPAAPQVAVQPAPVAPVPPPMMNGGIPNHHHPPPQQHPAAAQAAGPIPIPHLVHYVQHQPPAPHQAPQQMIPNGNVIPIQQAPNHSPQAIYIRGPGPPPQPPPPHQLQQPPPPQQAVLIQHQQPLFMNGSVPGAEVVGVLQHQPPQPGTTANSRTIRMIRLTPNGTYATTTAAVATGAGTGAALIPGPGGGVLVTTSATLTPKTTATALILTKPPPPKCVLCCLACCGLESLWFNPNFHFSRVIALICNILVDLLMILCLLSTNWLTTIKYRQGLWQYCIDVDSPRPLPFGLDDPDGCHWGRNAAYIKLSGFFAVACFSLALIATGLTSLGLSSRDPNKKYTFYRFALYINLGALLAIIVSLTLYPAFFYSELHHTNMVPANRPHWYFGWAYGVGWGAAIFLVGAILLLVCDKETEEIYYQERTIVHAATNNSQHHLVQQPSLHHIQQPQQQHLNMGNHLIQKA